MAVVVDKLLTIMGFKIEAKDLEKYRSTGKKAQREVGEGLRRATSKGAKGLSATSLAAGLAGGAVGALTVAAGTLASTLTGVLTGALQGVWSWLERLGQGVRDFTGEVFRANVEFENINTRLKTLMGAKAPEIIKELRQFAKDTPYELNDITDAFIRLTGLGFDMSAENRTALGDLAAASNKTFGEMAEIMASANRGSAQMLDNLLGVSAAVKGGKLTVSAKRFGIEERTFKVGDQKELMRFLTDLGKAKGIEGGMLRLSRTLGGLLSTLKDSITGFLIDVGEGGFNDAVRALFTDLDKSASKTSGIAGRIGALMGKVIDFGRRVFGALNLDYIFGLVDSIFARVTGGFDKLAGGDAAAKVARMIELPFRALENLMMLLEGKGGESPLGKWLAQFENASTPLGAVARAFKGLVDAIAEARAEADDGGDGLLSRFLDVSAEHGLRILEVVLKIFTQIIEHRKELTEMMGVTVEFLGLMSGLFGMVMNLALAAAPVLYGLFKPVNDEIRGHIALLRLVITMLENLPNTLSGLGKGLGLPSFEGLGEIFAGGLPDGLFGVTGAASNRVAGAPGAAGGGATNNTTTNSTNNTNTINTGPITVNSPSELSGILGGLAGAARAAGGG